MGLEQKIQYLQLSIIDPSCSRDFSRRDARCLYPDNVFR